MNTRQFYKSAGELFGGVLRRHGFVNDKSRCSTFYRRVSSEVFHIVMPDLGLHCAWYDVTVFATSPLIEPSFEARFPDDLGVPTDVYSFLSENGVGLDQAMFNCKHEENFRRVFNNTVAPLLESVAIPYLNRFQTLAELLPRIVHPVYKAFATHHVTGDAQVMLTNERDRLESLDRNDEVVISALAFVNQLLSAYSN